MKKAIRKADFLVFFKKTIEIFKTPLIWMAFLAGIAVGLCFYIWQVDYGSKHIASIGLFIDIIGFIFLALDVLQANKSRLNALDSDQRFREELEEFSQSLRRLSEKLNNISEKILFNAEQNDEMLNDKISNIDLTTNINTNRNHSIKRAKFNETLIKYVSETNSLAIKNQENIKSIKYNISSITLQISDMHSQINRLISKQSEAIKSGAKQAIISQQRTYGAMLLITLGFIMQIIANYV